MGSRVNSAVGASKRRDGWVGELLNNTQLRSVATLAGATEPLIARDAKVRVAVSAERGSSYVTVRLSFRARMRSGSYTVSICDAEATPTPVDQPADCWNVGDSEAFRRTSALVEEWAAEIFLVGGEGPATSGKRAFHSVPVSSPEDESQVGHVGSYEVDLSDAGNAECDVEVSVALVLSTLSPGLFVYFDNRFHLEDFEIDVRRLWGQLEVAFALVPLFVSVEELTAPNMRREAKYLARVNSDVGFGQGFVLLWEKRGMRNIL